MNLKNNTVLITGGSSGIGFELSKVLIQKGNTVIICGKSDEKLAEAKKAVPKLITYHCDLADSNECIDFANRIKENHPGLNVLVNNAAIVNKIDFLKDDKALELAENEYQTNLLAPLRLIKLLYSTMEVNESPAIINITTGLIYAPRTIYPFYNSSKSALHSFTQTLRINVKNEKTEVYEVMFPAVRTPWHKGNRIPTAICILCKIESGLTFAGKFKNMSGQSHSEKMRALITVWQTSGQTQNAFAEANHVNIHTFKYWLYKIRGEQSGAGSFIRLDQVRLPELCLRYPNGVELMVPAQTSPAMLRELVKIGG